MNRLLIAQDTLDILKKGHYMSASGQYVELA